MSWRELGTLALGVGVEPVGTQPAVPAPTGGKVVDEQARATLVAVLAVLGTFGLTELPAPGATPAAADQVVPPVQRRPRRAG